MKRREAALALIPLFVLTAVGTLSVAPAVADGSGPSGTVTATTECNPDGSFSPYIDFTTSFSGLIPYSQNAAYDDVVTFNGKTKTYTEPDGTSYWYADDNGEHQGGGRFGYTTATDDVPPGTGFTWVLEHLGGPDPVEVAHGSGSVSDAHCGKTPPPRPDKPSFSLTPKSLQVAKSRKFDVPFQAAAKATGTINVVVGKKSWASSAVTVPKSGKIDPTLRLTKAEFKKLSHKRKLAAKVTVSVQNAGGSAHGSVDVTLKAPKPH